MFFCLNTDVYDTQEFKWRWAIWLGGGIIKSVEWIGTAVDTYYFGPP